MNRVPVGSPPIPLADYAASLLATLARVTGSAAIAALDGATLLGERAALGGMAIPGRVSAGGGCRLFDTASGAIALNLARPDDRALLPALFGSDDLDPADDAAIARHAAIADAATLTARGREMGLAIAGTDEAHLPAVPVTLLAAGLPATTQRRRPRVLDLSALWAGPLAAHLLWLAGAEVTKVESRTRPDAARGGDPAFFALLNQGKASVALDVVADRSALLGLIARADIVIEAARPRALAQCGIDAAALVRAVPGLVWLTITAHGATGGAAGHVGFGDDVATAAGLSAALRRASGRDGFAGDAIADPLTGITAATAAWQAWSGKRGGRYGVAMRDVAATALTAARAADPPALDATLAAWRTTEGRPFPPVPRRPAATVTPFGADTQRLLVPC